MKKLILQPCWCHFLFLLGMIAIPWYLIVDKSGEIVFLHTANPSEGESLRNELEKASI